MRPVHPHAPQPSPWVALSRRWPALLAGGLLVEVGVFLAAFAVSLPLVPRPAPAAEMLSGTAGARSRTLLRIARAGSSLAAFGPAGKPDFLTLRKCHIDVYVEDGFARTTIDQTYFNHLPGQLEGTFFFAVPPDASVTRLAMYVDGTRMEGGVVERHRARAVFEEIVSRRKDPALLEYVDARTLRLRVFPLEGRQEKRILVSYVQKLPSCGGQLTYCFPAGHTLEAASDWSFHARVQGGARLGWESPSHPLAVRTEGDDLVLDGAADEPAFDRDIVLHLQESGGIPEARFAVAQHEGSQYLLLRFRPECLDLPWLRCDGDFLVEWPALRKVRVSDPAGGAVFLGPAFFVPGTEVWTVVRLPAAAPLPTTVRITGTCGGRPFERLLPIGTPRTGADYLPRTWAKLEIERLFAEDAARHREAIVALSKSMDVMTPFTSLLVLENEEMYARYQVDRGRKDHWAPYSCPDRIEVVYEPQIEDSVEMIEPEKDLDLTNPEIGSDDAVNTNFSVDRIEDISVPGPVDPTGPVGIVGIPTLADASGIGSMAGTLGGMGEIEFTRPFAGRSGATREKILQQGCGNKLSEAAVARGLERLAERYRLGRECWERWSRSGNPTSSGMGRWLLRLLLGWWERCILVSGVRDPVRQDRVTRNTGRRCGRGPGPRLRRPDPGGSSGGAEWAARGVRDGA